MSLDIYLKDSVERTRICTCCNCDNEHEVTYFSEIASFNMTHNLEKMADAADIYDAVWRPDEHNISFASEMIKILEDGLERLESDPEFYKKYNPSNGWGCYEGLVKVLREYLEACKKHPHAKITVSR